MDFMAVYHFLFETYAGIGCLVGIGLVASLVACVIMERRTRKRYKNHQPSEDDWSFFDDDAGDGVGGDAGDDDSAHGDDGDGGVAADGGVGSGDEKDT